MQPEQLKILRELISALDTDLGDIEGVAAREAGVDQDTMGWLRDQFVRDGYLKRGSPRRDGSGRIYAPGKLMVTAKGRRAIEPPS